MAEVPTGSIGGGAEEATTGAAEQPHGLLQRAGGAVLHLLTEQFQTPPTPGMSEHFGNASKRNDLMPAVYIPPRRLTGRH